MVEKMRSKRVTKFGVPTREFRRKFRGKALIMNYLILSIFYRKVRQKFATTYVL